MLLAIVAVILGAVLAVAAVRLSEYHSKVGNLLSDLDQLESTRGSAASGPADVLFTETLLALSKVGLRAPDDSRAPELSESSSLVSVRPLR